MTTVAISGSASKIVKMNRVRGTAAVTFKTGSLTEALRVYNQLVLKIKDTVMINNPEDEDYNISITQLGSMRFNRGSQEVIRKLERG